MCFSNGTGRFVEQVGMLLQEFQYLSFTKIHFAHCDLHKVSTVLVLELVSVYGYLSQTCVVFPILESVFTHQR